MHRLFRYSVLAGLTLLINTNSASANLIKNGSFETRTYLNNALTVL